MPRRFVLSVQPGYKKPAPLMSDANLAEVPAGRATTRVGEANVEKILDAALTVFASFGFRGSRIDQIAEAAGMSKPNLLYYFPTKQALYTAVLTRTLDMWLEPLRAIDEAQDPRAALTDYIKLKLAYSRSHPDASRLFAIEVMQGAPMLAPTLATDLAALVEAKVEILSRWIDEGRLASIDPRHLLFHIWATTQHYADFAAQIRTLTGKGLDDEATFQSVTHSVLTTLLDGVMPR